MEEAMRVLFDAIRASFYSMLFLLLWAYPAIWVRQYDARLGGPLPPWTWAVGIVCMALGAALALTCIGTFVVRGRGTPAPFDAPRNLVAVGIYRWVRNPMYLSGCTVMIGYALYVRSAAVLLLAAGMWLAEHLFVLLYEEPTLRAKFNGSYEEYCRTVSRWLPRPPQRQTS
jgi:protein-S-isoprenylcysteine O-methyltransferase Ste14